MIKLKISIYSILGIVCLLTPFANMYFEHNYYGGIDYSKATIATRIIEVILGYFFLKAANNHKQKLVEQKLKEQNELQFMDIDKKHDNAPNEPISLFELYDVKAVKTKIASYDLVESHLIKRQDTNVKPSKKIMSTNINKEPNKIDNGFKFFKNIFNFKNNYFGLNLSEGNRRLLFVVSICIPLLFYLCVDYSEAELMIGVYILIHSIYFIICWIFSGYKK